MISVEEAKQIIQSNTEKTKIKTIPLIEAEGFILAKNVFSKCDVPLFDNSAMDGYAIKYTPLLRKFKVTDTIIAGDKNPQPVRVGNAARIFTGAPIPPGTDTVVEQESAIIKDEFVMFEDRMIKQGANIRCRGSQTKRRQIILKKGTRLNPARIALMASTGYINADVLMPPAVAVIVTGSEICTQGKSRDKFKIHDANGPAILTYLRSLKISNAILLRCADDPIELQELIHNSLKKFDIVILTGGISVGDFDFTKSAMQAEEVEQLIYKVSQKPGKPFFAGKRKKKWVFALPGNPAAVITCFNQYVKPCLLTMMGFENVWNTYNSIPLTSDLIKKSGITQFVKAVKTNEGLKICKAQDSFDLSAFAEADCLAELPAVPDRLYAGDLVNIYDL